MESAIFFRLMRAFPLLGLCAALFAQTPSPTSPRHGAVEGEVTDSVTHKPIAGARVKLQAGARSLFARCDASGHFQFPEVPLGDYVAVADQPGYMAVGETFDVRLAPDKPRATVNVLLQPYGIISGRLTDSAGAPLGIAYLQLLVLRTIDPKRKDPYPLGPPKATIGDHEMVVIKNASTNDLGEYRFAMLTPGNYYVSYYGPTDPSYSDPAERPTFYPQVLRAERARPVAVSAGQEVPHIDIQAIRQRALTVSGRYVPFLKGSHYRGARDTTVVAWPADAPEEQMQPGRFLEGFFTLDNFLPGRYVIEAVTVDDDGSGRLLLAGSRTVEVPNGDIDGVEISMQPPVSIDGAVVFAANCPAVPVSIAPKFDTAVASFNELVRSANLAPGEPQVTAPPRGTFTLPKLIPARYKLDIRPQPPQTAANHRYSVASAKLGDRDVLQDGFEISGQAPGTLRISIACGGQPGTQEVVR